MTDPRLRPSEDKYLSQTRKPHNLSQKTIPKEIVSLKVSANVHVGGEKMLTVGVKEVGLTHRFIRKAQWNECKYMIWTHHLKSS